MYSLHPHMLRYGQAEQARVAWINTEIVDPPKVTNPSINRVSHAHLRTKGK